MHLFHQRSQEITDPVMARESRHRERRITLTERKQIGVVFYQEPDHVDIATATGDVQWRITKISGPVDINSGLNQRLCGRAVAPPNNTMKRVVAIDTARINIGQIGATKIRQFANGGEHSRYFVVHLVDP